MRACDHCGNPVPESELRLVPANASCLANACCGACRAGLGWTDGKLEAYWSEFRRKLGVDPVREALENLLSALGWAIHPDKEGRFLPAELMILRRNCRLAYKTLGFTDEELRGYLFQ